jgi:hypothetical protein
MDADCEGRIGKKYGVFQLTIPAFALKKTKTISEQRTGSQREAQFNYALVCII